MGQVPEAPHDGLRRTLHGLALVGVRAVLGVAQEPFTLLLTSGGVGSGNMGEVVRNLVRAYPELQLLVVTRRNTALRAELEALPLGVAVYWVWLLG